MCGNLISTKNEETDELEFDIENRDAFKEIARNLKVLARASAEDKHMLVVGLKALGH